MNKTERTRAFIQDYFDALNDGRVQDISIAEDCTYSGSMLSESMNDAALIREHITQIAPFVARFEVVRTIVEASDGAVIVRLHGIRSTVVEGAVFFRVEDGRLKSVDNLFDTRQLLKGS